MSTPAQQNPVLELRNPDKNVRMEAAIELGTIADADFAPKLAEALALDPDFFVGETITWALVRCGSASVEPVIEILNNGSEIARVRAAHALGKLGDFRAVPHLISHLEDQNQALREKCIMALGNIGGDEAKAALVALLGSENLELATAVSKALESFGEDAISAIVKRISDEQPSVRAQVVDLLGFSLSEAAIPYLCAAADDEDVSVRIGVLTALGGLRHLDRKELLEVFQEALNDADLRVRLLAERLLAG